MFGRCHETALLQEFLPGRLLIAVVSDAQADHLAASSKTGGVSGLISDHQEADVGVVCPSHLVMWIVMWMFWALRPPSSKFTPSDM